MTPQPMQTEVLDQVERQLSREFETLPHERVSQVARESVEVFRGARLTQFVPLLAFRAGSSPRAPRGRAGYLELIGWWAGRLHVPVVETDI